MPHLLFYQALAYIAFKSRASTGMKKAQPSHD